MFHLNKFFTWTKQDITIFAHPIFSKVWLGAIHSSRTIFAFHEIKDLFCTTKYFTFISALLSAY